MTIVSSTRASPVWTPDIDSPQARALGYVTARCSGLPLDRTLPLTLNFHPDRYHQGTPLLHLLAADGLYRSQFETGTSNGSATAHEGGSRWRWESRIFGAAYDSALPGERPKYGALNHRRRAVGGSPRFGSAHLRLKPDVLLRSTFCYPDSVFEPSHFGVAARMALLSIAATIETDTLDDYIEAHVHGPLRLEFDVEALVLDPSHAGTEVEQLARALPCPLEWHAGFLLRVDTLRRHPTYRGPETVELGEALARDGCLTPATIGVAANSGRYDGQDLKKLWHCLARFGEQVGQDGRGDG